MKKKIGVLSLQGSFIEHIKVLKKINNVEPISIKYVEELEQIHGLILPGGESTAISKLLISNGLKDRIIELSNAGLPIWGTCAGMILLAKEIDTEDVVHLGVMDITVRRNAFGSQLDSFYRESMIPSISYNPIPQTYIRAPIIIRTGKNVRVLDTHLGMVVAALENNLFATSFHPELNNNTCFHEYFCNNC